MKKVLLTFVLLVGIVFGLMAQKLTYQAVVRDNNQRLVTNTAVKATVTIDFATGGDPTWTVDAATNLHGLLTFEFGDDALIGRDWTDATIAVRVANADDESTVYVNDAPRSVSAVPYALSVDGQSIQNYLDEKHYVDLAKLNDTLGKYPTTAAMDARHYLTSDSAAITTMKGNITANATNITSLQGNLSAAINKEKEDSTTLAGRIDALENASMDCDDVKDCIKDTLNSYTTTSDLTVLLQQLTARLDDQDTKIDSLAHMIDSLAKLIGGDEPTTFTCGTSKVKDVDSNEYNTVLIGEQCWMKENLRTTKKPNGDDITSEMWNPGGNSVETYGRLYSWTTVMNGATSSNANPSGVQGICPTGWHVPSDAEWKQLTDYVSGQTEYQCDGTAGNIAMALAGTSGWTSYPGKLCCPGKQQGSNNSTGFSALPAGNIALGTYYHSGTDAIFLSATGGSNNAVLTLQLYYNYADVTRPPYAHNNAGYSVRCLRDPEAPAAMSVTTDSANTVTNNGAKLHGNVTDMGGKTEVKAGFKYGTSEGALTSIVANADPMTAIGKFHCDITGLTPNTQYYYKAFAANGTDTVYGEVKNFTTTGSSFTCGTSKVKDVDNNEYNTVLIGNQCWMKENMRTTRYADSTSIELGTSTSTTTAYRYNPNGQETNISTYGYLYNWKAVTKGNTSSATPSGVQGICPDGWHVPSDAEFDTLTYYVYNSTNPDYKCSGCTSSGWTQYTNCIAKSLASTTGWDSDNSTCAVGNNPSANNATGFSAVPAGYYGGYYYPIGSNAYFWSATQYDSDNAYGRSLNSSSASVSLIAIYKYDGFSVRCLRDPE